jgi:hypothetical protein
MLKVAVTKNQVYRIRVGAMWAATATLSLSKVINPTAPSNDQCSGAAPVEASSETVFNTVGATKSSAQPLPGLIDVWYSFNPPYSGDVTIDTCQSPDLGTNLYIYSDGCSDLTAEHLVLGNGTAVQCPSGVFGQSITFAAAAGAQYKIRVAGFSNNAIGSGKITVSGVTSFVCVAGGCGTGICSCQCACPAGTWGKYCEYTTTPDGKHKKTLAMSTQSSRDEFRSSAKTSQQAGNSSSKGMLLAGIIGAQFIVILILFTQKRKLQQEVTPPASPLNSIEIN